MPKIKARILKDSVGAWDLEIAQVRRAYTRRRDHKCGQLLCQLLTIEVLVCLCQKGWSWVVSMSAYNLPLQKGLGLVQKLIRHVGKDCHLASVTGFRIGAKSRLSGLRALLPKVILAWVMLHGAPRQCVS